MDVLKDLSISETAIEEHECDLQDHDSDTIEIPAGSWQVAQKAPVTQPIKQTINPANYKFTFAPEVRPVKGTFDVACITLKWLDNPGIDVSRVKRMGNAVANTYNRLSQKQVKLNITADQVSVNFKHNANNLSKAEAAAKKVVDANKKTPGKYDYYLIVNTGVKARSNAGGNTAHLLNPLILTANHELGHLAPFKLEHAGILVNGRVVGSKDSYSFMSNYGSGLTAPQLRNLGWLPNQVAQYDIGSPATEIPMEYLNDEKPTDGFMKAVHIPANGGGKDLYLSIVQRRDRNVFALHQAYGANNDASSSDGGGGSIRVSIFGDQFKFRDLIFSKVVDNGNKAVIKIDTIPTPMTLKK